MKELDHKLMIENSFTYKGFPCVVKFVPYGFRCGYVGIPKDNPLYEIDPKIFECEIKCHGGISYIDNKLLGDDREDILWIGFDCGHAGDGYDLMLAWERYNMVSGFDISREALEHFITHTSDVTASCKPKSLDYVNTECERIVDQLIFMMKRYES